MIRTAGVGDAAEIATIYNHYVINTVASFEEDAITRAEMAQRIERHGQRYPWLVSDLVNTVTGYAYAAPWHSRAAYQYTVETTIYIDPAHLNRGIGTVLYERLLEQLRDLGVHAAVAVIALPNVASVALHERLGFSRAGRLTAVGYKFERWVDVGYWQAILS